MGLKPGFIAAFTVIAGAVTAWAVAEHLRPAPSPTAKGLWITIPEATMDARDVRVRRAMMRWFEQSQTHGYVPQDALVRRCGDDSDRAQPREEYELLVGDYYTSRENPRAWHVRLIPQGTQLDALITRAGPPLPPPPAPSGWPEDGSSFSPPSPPPPQPQHHSRPLQSLQGLREALSNADAWRTQAPDDCHDGRPTMFAACIDGQFHASVHTCDDNAAASEVWNQLSREFPEPPP